MKNHAVAAVEIGRGNSEWNLEFFEGLNLQNPIEERNHAVVGGESVTRNSPARKRREAARSRDTLEFLDRHATAVDRADERSNAGSSNDTDGNALFFEDLQNSNVSNAAGEASTKCYAD